MKIKRAIYDLFYMFGLWIIMRLNPVGAGELMAKWAGALQKRAREIED